MRQIQRTFLVRKLMPAFMAVCAFFMFMPTALAAEGDTGTDQGFSWCELADGTVEVTGYTGGFTMDVTIPDTLSGKTVTAIAKEAFKDCPDFCGRVTLPSTLKTIGEKAFHQCASMTDTNLPEGLMTIGNSAFDTCSSLNDVTFPSTLTSIGDCAFSNCDGFTNITLHAGFDIGNNAFSSCEGITSVTIPEGISTMGLGTFENCTKLESVTIPSTMTTIPSNMFNSCTKLNSVTLLSTLKTIGLGSFNNCQTLENITIPEGATDIGIQSFGYCSKLKEITIPQSVTSIGNGAFEFCPELTDVHILGNTPIGENAFDECGKLESVTMSKVTSIGAYAFRRCKALTSVTIPGSVKTIGECAFSQCSALTEAMFEDGVETIGSSVFEQCTALTSLTLPDTVSSIGSFAFAETSITSVNIPSSLKVIGKCVFGACTQLENVTIPDSVTSIEGLAFAYCPLQTEITIPSSVTSIGDKSFWNTGLSKITILNPNAAFGAEVFLDTTLSDGIYGFGTSTAKTYATDNSIPFHALCTVVFDTNGGSEISDIYPIPGDKISAPEAPTKDGYTFEGWYKEEACTNAWNFDTDTVSGDMTLYAKWDAVPVPTPVPTPQPTPNPDEKLITVTGTLLGDDGEPLAGYTVELHSTPRTTVTDAKGRYTFADVEIADHSLTVKDKSGSTLKSFAIAVQSGEDFAWSKPDDNSITAVVQDDTASIDVTININKDGEVTVEKIKNIINPQTGDNALYKKWMPTVTIGFGILLIALLILYKRSRQTS